MFKRLTAIFLLVTLISSNFSRLFVYAGFELNKKYIAATLCENIDRPWLHCDGLCYYMKKIKQADEKEKSEERPSQKSRFQESLFERYTTVKFHTILLQIVNTPYITPVSSILDKAVFHPPKFG